MPAPTACAAARSNPCWAIATRTRRSTPLRRFLRKNLWSRPVNRAVNKVATKDIAAIEAFEGRLIMADAFGEAEMEAWRSAMLRPAPTPLDTNGWEQLPQVDALQVTVHVA